jgi:hypothetical protein
MPRAIDPTWTGCKFTNLKPCDCGRNYAYGIERRGLPRVVASNHNREIAEKDFLIGKSFEID